MNLVFLTPLGALLGLGLVLTLATGRLRERRAARVRQALGLAAPPRRLVLPRAAAIAAAVGLVAAAAAQPALAATTVTRVRTDAAVYVVVDVSRSMLASRGPRGRTRFARAVAEAEQLRAGLPGVPVGLAGFTDRVVPYLLPSARPGDFDLAAEQAPAIEKPPPQSDAAVGTNLEAMTSLAAASYFSPRARHRAAVVFTDGESVRYHPTDIGQLLRMSRIHLFAVRTWDAAERIYDARRRADPHYRPDPSAAAPLESLTRAAGGGVYGEANIGGLAAAVLRALGHGRTRLVRSAERMTPLTPYVLAAAALPLAFLLLQGAPRRRL